MEHARHHETDLGFVGPSGAGDGRFHFGRSVLKDLKSMTGRDQHRHPGGLGRAHHGHQIVLREDPFDRDDLGMVGRDPAFQSFFDGQQSYGGLGLGRGSDDASLDQASAARTAINDADATSGQTWVDPEHSHDASYPR
jgi:hypothetical protein